MSVERISNNASILGAIAGKSRSLLVDRPQSPGEAYKSRRLPMGWLSRGSTPVTVGYREDGPDNSTSIWDYLKGHSLQREAFIEGKYEGLPAVLSLKEYQPARLKLGRVVPVSTELVYNLRVNSFDDHGRLNVTPVENFIYSSERGLLGTSLDIEPESTDTRQTLIDISDYLRQRQKVDYTHYERS